MGTREVRRLEGKFGAAFMVELPISRKRIPGLALARDFAQCQRRRAPLKRFGSFGKVLLCVT